MAQNWPPNISKDIYRRLCRKYGEELAGVVMEAALARPYDEVNTKGGAWAYVTGIVKNKKADAIRKQQKRRDLNSQAVALEDSRREAIRSRIFQRGGDVVTAQKRTALPPPDTQSRNAARTACRAELGRGPCRSALGIFARLERRKTYEMTVVPRLRKLVGFISEFRAFQTEALSIAWQGPESRRDTVADAVYTLPFLKALNIGRRLTDWVGSEPFMEFVKLLEESQSVLFEAEAVESESVLEPLIALEVEEKRRLFTKSVLAKLEIAAGWVEPPTTGSAWERLCVKWKQALKRIRAKKGGGQRELINPVLVPLLSGSSDDLIGHEPQRICPSQRIPPSRK